MNFLWVFLLFVSTVLYGLLVDYWTKEEKTKRKQAQGELNPIVTAEEKKYNLKGNSLFNLRMMSLFMAVEEEKEKETLREKTIKIVDDYKMKPGKFFALQISRVILYTAVIYFTIFYLYAEPNIYLAWIAIVIIALMNVLQKNYVLLVILSVVGVLLYPKIPATMLLLIILNRVWAIVKKMQKTVETAEEQINENQNKK